jgi:hypothetical protein
MTIELCIILEGDMATGYRYASRKTIELEILR